MKTIFGLLGGLTLFLFGMNMIVLTTYLLLEFEGYLSENILCVLVNITKTDIKIIKINKNRIKYIEKLKNDIL